MSDLLQELDIKRAAQLSGGLAIALRLPFPRIKTDEEFEDEVIDVILERAIPSLVPIWQIRSGETTLRATKPMLVRIALDDNMVIAGNDVLSVYGAGPSRQEALDELMRQVVHFFNYYKTLPNERVIGEAARQKKMFSEQWREV